MSVPSYTGRNRPASNGGPSGVQRSYATQLKEAEPLFNSYEHLSGLPRGDAALTMLRKVASLVKPIMRKRGWKVQILAEFLPAEHNLLGLNINKGYKICIRLRFHNNPDLFMPVEQVVDTMLHELSHNVWGDHDSNFHRLWDELRDEHETLIRKGYTGEGFLSAGHTLGGGRRGVITPHEMRGLARASAEKRQAQGTLTRGSGQRLGGTPLHRQGGDVRSVIADQVTRRTTVDRGCASGRGDANKLADQSSNNTFKTKAEEDDANDRAIAQALYELMEEEEERKLQGTYSAAPPGGGLAWSPDAGLFDPRTDAGSQSKGKDLQHPSEEEQLRWAMEESSAPTPTSATNHSTTSLSPVSPLTPERMAFAPPVPTQTKATRPISRLVNSIDSQTQTQAPSKRTKTTPLTTTTTTSSDPPPRNETTPIIDLSEPFNHNEWTCEICTCINPLQFLACDACGCERPQMKPQPQPPRKRPSSTAKVSRGAEVTKATSLGWNCEHCGSFMEHKWWTCSGCGVMKSAS